MAQLNSPKPIRRKPQKFHWSAWLPYPISWLRALILVPIAFPGAILIFFGLTGAIISAIGNSPVILIFSVVFGLLIPTIILSFPYHFFWFIWKKQPSLTRWPNWIPGSSSLWEAFYATFVIGFSFALLIAIFTGLWFLSCKFSHETAEEISGCVGRATGRAAKAILGATANISDFDGSGVITRRQDDFVIKPWFVIWLIIAAYFYQIEYVVRQRFIPKLKVTVQNHQSGHKAYKVDDADVELNRLRGEMGISRIRKGKAKPK